MSPRTAPRPEGERGWGEGFSRATLAIALCAAMAAACGDDDDDGARADAGSDDAGPWVSGTMTCSDDVISDYATRQYTFADPFDRQDLGPNWDTATQSAWAIDSRLVVTGAADGPGPLAMVSTGQIGTDTAVWVDVERSGGWSGAPAVLCRADGPPMTVGYGMRVLGDRIELFEQNGAAAANAPLSPALADDGRARFVLGCTGDTVTGFVFALDQAGVAGEQLGCASWRSGDAPRAGAVSLTQTRGETAFDTVRILLDP